MPSSTGSTRSTTRSSTWWADEDREAFRKLLGQMLNHVRKNGTEVPVEELVESDVVLPEPDITLEEAAELFTGEGILPD